ncbi:tRNA (pseudouridine(54)-N(1))-methyltransferase TrmY [Candidatus Bipolaricaulota bacterium]|nr:tRNA (pseudouridine(54)-N(1))-methyltransferase TrmY [Candidatus Bipolaricaulota bacterium]
MRRFVILGHKAPVSPAFTLDDLPGSAGRIDVLCRAIGASLFLSHDLRRDVEVTLVLRDQVEIRIVGSRVKRLNPDERSTAALLRKALARLAEIEDGDGEEIESTPGIFVRPSGLSEVLDRVYQTGSHPVMLHEHGDPIESMEFPEDTTFFLSDHEEFSEDDYERLDHLERVSLGRQPLHTSQCITITHYLMDLRRNDTNAELVLCHKVWGDPKAQLVKNLLEDFGIPATIVSQASQSHLPLIVDGLGEMRIMVFDRDLHRAREIVADYFEELIDRDD